MPIISLKNNFVANFRVHLQIGKVRGMKGIFAIILFLGSIDFVLGESKVPS